MQESNGVAKLSGVAKVESKILFNLDPHELKNSIIPNPANRVDQENRHHIMRLRKSIRENGYMQEKPIIVGSDLVIKAGHHRYYAAIAEGSGAWVQIDDDYDLTEHSLADNIQKPWSTLSWIRLHANAGSGDFPRIQDFLTRYGFGVKVGMMLLSDKQSEPSADEFDVIAKGTFVVKDWGKAEWKAERILDFAPYFENDNRCRSTLFAAAILKCLKVKGYNHQRMLKKVAMQTRKLRLQRTRQENLEMLEEIYNYRTSQRLRLSLTEKVEAE